MGRVIYAAIILAAIATVLLIRSFVIEPFSIPTESMCDTLQVGDSVLAEKITLELGGTVSAGDVIVFENPEKGSEKDVLCKRVVACAGQTVDMKNGSVYIDGKKITEDYAKGDSYPLYLGKGKRISYPYEIPEGEIWVMGDNRGKLRRFPLFRPDIRGQRDWHLRHALPALEPHQFPLRYTV